MLDSPHRHHHQGKVFNVKVQLALPGDDVVVDMERPDRDGHEDVYVVLRDAFDAARGNCRRAWRACGRREAPRDPVVNTGMNADH